MKESNCQKGRYNTMIPSVGSKSVVIPDTIVAAKSVVKINAFIVVVLS